MKIKTLAITEDRWEKLKDLMKEEKLGSFNEVIDLLLKAKFGIHGSMFGVDRGKIKWSAKEHEEMSDNDRF